MYFKEYLTGGVDFNTATLIATFASGMNISNVNIALINDSIPEGLEKFNLTLSVSSTLGPAITVGNRDSATGIITDSTGECIIMYICNNKTLSVWIIN